MSDVKKDIGDINNKLKNVKNILLMALKAHNHYLMGTMPMRLENALDEIKTIKVMLDKLYCKIGHDKEN